MATPIIKDFERFKLYLSSTRQNMNITATATRLKQNRAALTNMMLSIAECSTWN